MQRDRREAWQAYEVWSRRREIIAKTHEVPPKGYAADLLTPDYQPPEGTDMPPVDVEMGGPSGFRLRTNLLPGMVGRPVGNSGDDE